MRVAKKTIGMFIFGCNKVQEVWAEAGLRSFIQ